MGGEKIAALKTISLKGHLAQFDPGESYSVHDPDKPGVNSSELIEYRDISRNLTRNWWWDRLRPAGRAGHGPVRDGKATSQGKVGKDLTVEQGYQVAREVGLSLLATVRANLGSLDKVRRVVKVLGMVNSADGFGDQPKVINGFSDLMVEVFGEVIGKHARSAVGMEGLPVNIPVEIEMVLEVE